MRWLTVFFSLLVVPAVFAAPALEVGQADGKPLIKAVASRMAAWRPTQDGLVVVIPAESGTVEVGDLPKGLSAEKISQNGLTGVFLKGASHGWQVVQDGANWLVRPGGGGKSQSVLMLKDGWRVAGKTVVPQTVNVAGKSWQVGLVNEGISAAGSVVGAVRAGGAAVEIADEKTVEPVKEVVKESVKAAPQEAMKTPVKSDLKAETLKPVMKPAVVESALATGPVEGRKLTVVETRAVPFRGELASIEPAAGEVEHGSGRVEPKVAPLLLKREISAVMPDVSATSGLAKVQLHAGPSMKALSVSPVADEILPKVLGEIYLPGTVVSLTLPEDGHGLSHEAPHAAEVPVSSTVQAAEDVVKVSETLAMETASKTWNQVTLDPIAAALEEQKVSQTAEVSFAAPVEHVALEDEAPAKDVNRLFPVKLASYFDQMTDALQAVAAAPDGSTRANDAQVNLAQVYLVWQRPEEALAVIAALPQRADGQPASPQARLYAALAHVARGEVLPEKQWNDLLNLGGTLSAHAKLWKAVAASKNGDYATALKIWPQERGILPQYPAYLRSMAQQAQATALVMVGDRNVAQKVVDDLVEGYNGEMVPVGLVRLQGLVRMGTSDEAEGLEYLAKAAEDVRDPAEAYRAKFEFVRALQQRKDLSDKQVLQYLSDLWFDWRGDSLERDVLNALADLYNKQDDPREALQHWQVLVKAFPRADNMSEITGKMSEAFLRVYDPENPKVYDVLSYLGLYYDFSELVPTDGRGDQVQEEVARMLVNINLWARAVPILEQQLTYRPLDPAAQGRLALMLAEAYGNLGKAADGLKVLDKWQKVATTTVLTRAWKIEDAKLLLLLNRPQAAGKVLTGLEKDDTEGRDLKIEATWAAKEWSSTIPLLQEKLAHVPASQLVSDTDAQLASFRLAYAYGQLQDGRSLGALSSRYESGLSKLPQLADDIGAVAAGTGVSASVVAAGPLAPLTTALNDLNRMTDRVERTRDDIKQQRQQQQEYNDKMRYMELLPPPAL